MSPERYAARMMENPPPQKNGGRKEGGEGRGGRGGEGRGDGRGLGVYPDTCYLL